MYTKKKIHFTPKTGIKIQRFRIVKKDDNMFSKKDGLNREKIQYIPYDFMDVFVESSKVFSQQQ